MNVPSMPSCVYVALLFVTLGVFPPVGGMPVALGDQQSRLDALIAAVRPALPFPSAADDGEVPADNSTQSKWFVVWPSDSSDLRIVVKANPLHPETQKAGAEAMDKINAAVAAAERKAQAAYDKALDELRRTGKGSDIDAITLEDEGVAGERIDAEFEMVIELQPAASFDIASASAPVVTAGTRGVTWMVSIPANTYRATRGADLREHFRAAQTRLYFGAMQKPHVNRKGDEPLFNVAFPATANGFAVVLRGNESLVKQLTTSGDWSTLSH